MAIVLTRYQTGMGDENSTNVIAWNTTRNSLEFQISPKYPGHLRLWGLPEQCPTLWEREARWMWGSWEPAHRRVWWQLGYKVLDSLWREEVKGWGKLNRRISRLWLLIHALSHARPTKVSHSANYINDPAIRDISPLVQYQDPRL